MINCLIADDEPLARDMIRMHLASFPAWHVVQECMNALEAYEALHRHDVQVMFLDIQMPHIKGNDFLRSLRSPPLVVFVTAYSDYAVEGYELDVADYLVKPVTSERFRQCIDKLEKRLAEPTVAVKPVAVKPEQETDHLFIKADNRQVRVMYDDILFLEAKRDFTKLYLKNKTLLASLHLKMMEDLLPSNRFLRIHRSFMVSLTAITSVYGNMVEIQGYQVPIGSNYRDALHDALKL